MPLESWWRKGTGWEGGIWTATFDKCLICWLINTVWSTFKTLKDWLYFIFLLLYTAQGRLSLFVFFNIHSPFTVPAPPIIVLGILEGTSLSSLFSMVLWSMNLSTRFCVWWYYLLPLSPVFHEFYTHWVKKYFVCFQSVSYWCFNKRYLVL